MIFRDIVVTGQKYTFFPLHHMNNYLFHIGIAIDMALAAWAILKFQLSYT